MSVLVAAGCGATDRTTLPDTVNPDGTASDGSVPPTFTISLTLDSQSSVSASNNGNSTTIAEQHPIAFAGADRTVQPGEAVVLNASDSLWNRTQPVTFTWTQIGGAPVHISDTQARLTTFTVPPESQTDDTFVFKLTVLQGTFHDEDSITLTVGEPADTTEPVDGADPPVVLATGIGLNPRSWGIDDVNDAFRMVAAAGSFGLVQLPFLWDHLHGNASFSTYSQNYGWLTQPDPATGKSLFQQYELAKVFAFDFLVPGGDPGTLSVGQYNGLASFQNTALADSFVTECIWIADYFQPEDLAIGVEIDSYLRVVSSTERAALLSALTQAFAIIRDRHPVMKVFCYFQYEAIRSHSEWNLIRPFVELSDATAFSTYPSSPVEGALNGYSAATLPDDYYADIDANLDSTQPVVFVEVGHPARPTPLFTGGSATEQMAFIDRFFSIIPPNTELALWTYLFDPDLSGVYPPNLAAHFGAMGQLRVSDTGNRAPYWSNR